MISALGCFQGRDKSLWTNNSYEASKLSLQTVVVVSAGAGKTEFSFAWPDGTKQYGPLGDWIIPDTAWPLIPDAS